MVPCINCSKWEKIMEIIYIIIMNGDSNVLQFIIVVAKQINILFHNIAILVVFVNFKLFYLKFF
jgi:hypothetical protein